MVLSFEQRVKNALETVGYTAIGTLFPNLWKLVAVRYAATYPIWPKNHKLRWPYGTRGQYISPEETTRRPLQGLKGMQAYAIKRNAHLVGEGIVAEKGSMFNRARNFLFGRGGLRKAFKRVDYYLNGGPPGYRAFARSPIGRSLHRHTRTLKKIEGTHAARGVQPGPPYPPDEMPDPDYILNPGAYRLPEPIWKRILRKVAAKTHLKISDKYRKLKAKVKSGFIEQMHVSSRSVKMRSGCSSLKKKRVSGGEGPSEPLASAGAALMLTSKRAIRMHLLSDFL
mmetsp:Transcript_58021/g.138111  ORF Transcript_58021/g.138111 Transcript_58021/m.138111 type:complete len:282 (-) Transcript_58021:4-849(-)